MVSRIPVHLRSCHPCNYHYKKSGVDWCSKFNEQIRSNRAKSGCLGFSVERQTRIMGSLYDAPEGRNVNKKVYGYDSDGNMETIKCYQDNILLFTVTLSYSGGNLTSQERIDAKKHEVG